jgi:hypothetical protein
MKYELVALLKGIVSHAQQNVQVWALKAGKVEVKEI